ncbi:MAG: hypothetical protein ABI778_12985, partial [Ignavibacteriota bacterium]
TKTLTEDVIYAACYGGIMRTTDGGTTWNNVLGADVENCFNSEIIQGSAGTFYAAIGSVYDGTAPTQQGIWRSIDGSNWNKISGVLFPKLVRRMKLATSESNENILYVLTESPVEWVTPDTDFYTNNSLLKYTYLSGSGSGSGGKWEGLISPYDYDPEAYYKSLGGYALVLAVHPEDPNQMIVGGTNLYYSETGFDSPSNFVKIGGYPFNLQPGTLHPDMHACLFSRKDHSKIYVATDGGIYTVPDISTVFDNWIYLSDGIATAQVYHSALDRETQGSDLIVSGLQDNNTFATESHNSNDPWFVLSGGDGMTSAVANKGTQVFGSWQYGAMACFSRNSQNITFDGYLPQPSPDAVSNFFTNFIIPPGSRALYEAEGNELWRFNDISVIPAALGYIKPDWTQIPEVKTLLQVDSSFITTFGAATNVSDRIYFGTNTARLYQIDNARDASPGIKNISGANFPKNGFIAGIEVDPINSDEIIVAFSNYNIESLFLRDAFVRQSAT